jgi:hypothetical protein
MKLHALLVLCVLLACGGPRTTRASAAAQPGGHAQQAMVVATRQEVVQLRKQ